MQKYSGLLIKAGFRNSGSDELSPEFVAAVNVFSVAHLEPCPTPADPYNRARPTNPDAVTVDNHLEWEVQELLDKRVSKSGSYLVRWKGYGPEHDMWRTQSALENCQDFIADFEFLTK
jgi:hypothetical protein